MKAVRTLTIAALAALALAACTAAPDGDALAAQVAAQEAAVAEAQTTFDAASAEFCAASEDYVLALDVYSDVLTQTETTVGDVQNVSTNLSEPREEAMQSAQSAVDAQQQLYEAQQALVDAQVALAEFEAGPSGTPSILPSQVAPPEALAPSESVDRVKQAESDFADVAEGINANTPLTEAAEEFRAAAVGLQLAWINLFVDTGCATESQIQSLSALASAYTVALQQALFDLEFYTGAIDGIYGPLTTQAVADFQTSVELPATGTMDAATFRALSDALEAKGLSNIATTAAVQQTLSLLGFWTGPIDGVWTDELTAAVVEFQTALGVPATGVIDAVTVAAFHQAIADFQAGQTPEPEPEPSPEPEPTPMPSPTPEPSETLAG